MDKLKEFYNQLFGKEMETSSSFRVRKNPFLKELVPKSASLRRPTYQRLFARIIGSQTTSWSPVAANYNLHTMSPKYSLMPVLRSSSAKAMEYRGCRYVRVLKKIWIEMSSCKGESCSSDVGGPFMEQTEYFRDEHSSRGTKCLLLMLLLHTGCEFVRLCGWVGAGLGVYLQLCIYMNTWINLVRLVINENWRVWSAEWKFSACRAAEDT